MIPKLGRAFLFVILTGAGCGHPTEVNTNRQLSYLAGDLPDGPLLDISRTGTIVEIAITTFGASCFEKGETDVVLEGRMAIIRPYEYIPDNCFRRDHRRFVHAAKIDFREPGLANLRIHGIDTSLKSVSQPHGSEIVVNRTLLLE